MRAKAMVVTAPGELAPAEFPVAEPGAGEVLVRTRATSVCATDVKVFHGRVGRARYPLIMGHEFVGEVVAVGREAAGRYGLREGDRVTPEPYIPCGRCPWCRTAHHYHNCPDVRLYGISMPCDLPPHLRGGYAEYVLLVDGSLLHRVDPETPDLAACLSSVVGNGFRWVKTLGRMGFGERLVISGAGSQGLCTLAAAIACGVGPIVLLGLAADEARFALAREFGARHIVAVDREDPLGAVPDLLGGPPDVVIETSGVPAAIRTALRLVRPSGRVVCIGLSGGAETPIAFDDLVWRDVSLVCGKGQAGNVADAVRLIDSRRFAFEKINNRRFGLAELGRALAETEHPPEGFIKAAVVFAADEPIAPRGRNRTRSRAGRPHGKEEA